MTNQEIQILESIAKAIFWRSFTQKQQVEITDIVNDIELSEMQKANEICELLDIGKRYNKNAICESLEKLNR